SDQERLLHRTRAEARAAARINHSAVVTVHDVLDHDARPWIVMELIEGRSLADAVKQDGRIEPAEAARIGLWVLRALRAAHDAGVLHRDVKPGNVLLSHDRRVLLTDFGIAQIEGDTTITRTGEVVGSVDYLAPERVRGHDPGPASDLWALGATLYTAVEGRSPFRRTSPLGTMQAVVEEEPAAPANAGALGPVLTALLRKDPAERPTAAQAEQMLAEVAEGRRSSAAQAHVPTQHGRYETGTTPQTFGAAPAFGTGSQTAAGTPYPPVTVGPHAPAPRRRRGLRTFALVVAVAAIVGAGGAVALQQWNSGSPSVSSSSGPTPSPSSTEGAQGLVPAGWQKYDDPLGFSLYLPKGWDRTVSIKETDGLTQVDYSPDQGKTLVRVAVDTAPDYNSSYDHMRELEAANKTRLKDFATLSMKQEFYRDRQSVRWEYTWTQLPKDSSFPGAFRALDVAYITRDGVEYALYTASPVADWDATSKRFTSVLRGWQPNPA
ncbi:MAG: serine/threonine protein kinase, partial [Streptomyces sp.]|nr:serine/threonine protein kinase [Streptomyces sp.]